MRKLFIRIGLGAAGVFVVGMFLVSLGRQVKSAAASAIRDGGRVQVPLAFVPFHLDGLKVGNVKTVQVERIGPERHKRLNLVVNLKGVDADQIGDCVITIGRGHDGLFDCESATTADLDQLVQIGEIRFEPGGVTRPIMLDRSDADGWDVESSGQVNIEAGEGSANIMIQGADGQAQVSIVADEQGASMKVRDESGKEVVKIEAKKRR